MESLADEMESMGDTEDPKAVKQLMRKMGKEMGEEMGEDFEQMMESGEGGEASENAGDPAADDF